MLRERERKVEEERRQEQELLQQQQQQALSQHQLQSRKSEELARPKIRETPLANRRRFLVSAHLKQYSDRAKVIS